MAEAQGCAGVDNQGTGAFKSPLRILARAFRRSRDRWKAKYKTLWSERKRERNRAADRQRARDRWRHKAEAAQAETERLRSELAAAQARVAALEAAQKKG